MRPKLLLSVICSAGISLALPGAATAQSTAPVSSGAASTGSSTQANDAASLQLLRALRSGAISVPAATDGAHGLVIIHYEEDPPVEGATGVISSQHLCGATLSRASASIRTLITGAFRQAGSSDGIECDRDTCTVPGMEYQPAVHFRFRHATYGQLRLAAILVTSEALLGDEWFAAMNRYVDDHVAAAEREGCGPAAAPASRHAPSYRRR